MKKTLIIIAALAVTTSYSSLALAGVPLTTLDCKSKTASITGRPFGEDFDLKIKVDHAVIRYTNTCDGTECPVKENYGFLTVVDALYDKVYTIYFANSENNNRGEFYALPNTVKYQKNSRGYTAQFKGMYLGDDPRSNEPFKASVKFPGIELDCTQKSEL